MTTVILKKNKLHGDRKIYTHKIFIDGPKINMHPSKKFAIGISGSLETKDELTRIMDFALTLLEKFYEGDGGNVRVDSSPMELLFKGIYILTKDKMFEITTTTAVGYTMLNVINSDEFRIIGTGEMVGKRLLTAGKKIKEIYPIVSKIDPFTSSYFDTISSKDLISWGK